MMDISNKKFIFFAPAIAFSILVVSLAVNQVYAVQRGDTVQFTANTHVRAAAGTSCYGCYVITTAQSGSTASIIGGPQSADGYQWWNIRLTSSGQTGWAISNYMSVVSAPAPAPTLSVSVNPTSITVGQSTTFSWSSSNATSCTGSRGGSYPTSDSFVDYPSSTKTYGMTCTGSGGSSGYKYATVTVSAVTQAPMLNFSASSTSINPGQSSTLSWSTSNVDGCAATNGWNGFRNPIGSQVVSPTSTTTYTLTCSGAGGTTSPQNVTVTVSTQAQPPSGLPATPCGTTSNLQKQDFSPVSVCWSYTGLGGSTYGISCTQPSGGSCGGITRAYPVSSTGAGTGSTTLYPTFGVYGTYLFAISGQGTDGSPVFANAAAVIIQPTTEPETPPTPQCSDGVDNDGDGKIDMNDPGCSSSTDTDETDVIPPATPDAPASVDIRAD